MPRARTRAKIASRKKFALYTPPARGKPRQVIEGTKENGRAYGRFASGGRFLSVDPVTTDANTGGSFNRYAYANNSPNKYIDPDGREAECSWRNQCTRIDYTAGVSGGSAPSSAGVIDQVRGMIADYGQSYADQFAEKINKKGSIDSKFEADALYITNSDPNLKVNLDASRLTVRAISEWAPDPKGGMKAAGYVSGVDYWIHGQVIIRIRPDGTVGIYDQRYHYEMHSDFSARGIARNIGTFIGEPKMNFNNTPFKIHYYGSAKLIK